MTEEEKLNIKKQFCDIIKGGIAPILKSAEFKKNGNNFYAHVGELDWCINMQKTDGDLMILQTHGNSQSTLV